jgi:hypothetical protein
MLVARPYRSFARTSAWPYRSLTASSVRHTLARSHVCLTAIAHRMSASVARHLGYVAQPHVSFRLHVGFWPHVRLATSVCHTSPCRIVSSYARSPYRRLWYRMLFAICCFCCMLLVTGCFCCIVVLLHVLAACYCMLLPICCLPYCCLLAVVCMLHVSYTLSSIQAITYNTVP